MMANTSAKIRARFKQLFALIGLIPPLFMAIILMVASAVFFSSMNTLIRSISDQVPLWELVAFRNLFSVVFFLPWVLKVGSFAWSTPFPRFYIWRTCIGLTGMSLMFWSVYLLPAAEAVALNFAMPLFAVVGAALFLGEKVGPRRWSATLVGFVGVLIIVRPGTGLFKPEAIVPILAAATMAAAILSVKYLTSRGENPARAVFLFALMATPVCFVIAIPFWIMPTVYQLWILFLIGVTGSLAHLSFTGAFKLADASFLMAFDYLRLPLVALFAFWFLGEIPNAWIWPGAVVIAAAAVYIAHRETRKRGGGGVPNQTHD